MNHMFRYLTGHLTHRAWVAIVTAGLIIAGTFAPLGWPSVNAQEGGAEQVWKTVGPYEIGIDTVLSAEGFGDIHYAVTVLDAATKQPVPGARVLIRTSSDSDSTDGWAHALNTPQTPELYKATLQMEDPGTWDIKVEVSSDLGDIVVELPPVEVREQRGSRAGELVFVGVLVVLALGGLYLSWSIRREQRRRDAAQTPA